MRAMILATAVLLSVSVPGTIQAAHSRDAVAIDVMIGGETYLDACGSTGIVSGLSGGPGSFLAIRTGPGTGFQKKGLLRQNARVWICETRGNWLGIVYAVNESDCGIASPVPRRTRYRGPCTSGWVSRHYVQLEAG